MTRRGAARKRAIALFTALLIAITGAVGSSQYAAAQDSETSSAATTATASANPATIELALTNTPANGTSWTVGETMQFKISLTSNQETGKNYGFKPTATNLYTDVNDTTQVGACRWSAAVPGTKYECQSGDKYKVQHVVTADDATAGTFTPQVTYTMYVQNDYKGSGQELAPASAPAQTILPATTSEPADDPSSAAQGDAPAADPSTPANDPTEAQASITVTNPKDDGIPWQAGETINFELKLTNNSSIARAFSPASSNLANYSGCKWQTIAPGAEMTCAAATYTVQQTDVDSGNGFTPNITWNMYPGNGYTGTPTALKVTTGQKIDVAKNVITMGEITQTSEVKTSYDAGDVLTFSATVTNSSEDDQQLQIEVADNSMLKGSCSQTLEADGSATCSNLTYTLTADDIEIGSIDASFTVNALSNGKIVQQLTRSSEIKTPHDWPEAKAFEAPDADPALSENLSTLDILDDPVAGQYNIRIPSIVVASNGDLLASYDLRPTDGGKNGGDAPNANWIVQRRSTDGGQTWGPRTIIAKGTNGESDGEGRKGYSDPSYVVDYNTGKIFNFHVYSQISGAIADDPEYSYENGKIDESDPHTLNFGLATSTDNGYTWTESIITDQVLGEKGEELQSCFATSGGGTQKMQEPNKGRLLQQFICVGKDHSNETPRMQAMTVYSDDNGATWKSGELTELYDNGNGYFNENKVAELSNGDLIMNSRVLDNSEAQGHRIVAISHDGGETWGDYHTQEDLIDPSNNADIIRAYPNADPGTLRSKVLLFSNTKSEWGQSRSNGTISVSYDDGATWSVARTFNAGKTGYTTMAVQPDGSIGLLSEPSEYNQVGYQSFTMQWVDPSMPTEPKVTVDGGSNLETGVDGQAVNIPVTLGGDDPTLDNTVEVTGLPEGLSYDSAKKAIVGTTNLKIDSQQIYNVTITFSEPDDGTGRPRVGSSSFTFVLAPVGQTPNYQGRTWYVSADGSDENNGLSEDTPFQTLNKINELTLMPGDQVLLRRGDTFNDQYLHIKGSGSAEKQILISAYGDESKGLPVINTNGSGQWYEDYNTQLDSASHVFKGTVSTALLLKDVEYVTVEKLEITNARTADTPGEYNDGNAMDRTGVAVIAENAGTLHNITLQDLYIHDVNGNIYDKHMANGGIYVIAHKPKNEEATGIARYDGVNILRNRVEDVSRWGIGVGYTGYTAQFTDAAISDETAATYGQTNVVVRDNYVKGAGGDSITVFYSLRPLVESNISKDGAKDMNTEAYVNQVINGKDRGGRVAAAIWTWKSKDAVFQYNESFNMLNSAQGNGDGMAWDADSGDGTIYQYNYSHGNTGGTVMFCDKQAINSTFRYNISYRDLAGLIDIPGNPDAHVYNNTFYMADGVTPLGKHPSTGNATIENNIFYYTGAQKSTGNWTDSTGNKVYDNNLYYNIDAPATDTHAINVAAGETVFAGNPDVDAPKAPQSNYRVYAHNLSASSEATAFDSFRLADGSPAANMGKVITDANGFIPEADFFGTTLEGTPDVGAIQASGDRPPYAMEGVSIADWKARNASLDDYKKLVDKIADENNTMTWLFTGDSITHGVLHTQGLKRYSEYFEDNLRTSPLMCYDRSKDVVLNTGVSSSTTNDLRTYADSWLNGRDADVVFMTFGMNDGRQTQALVPLDTYIQNLKTSIQEVRDAGGIPILMTQNYTSNDEFNTNLTKYFDAERQLAEDEGVIMIDFARWWMENNFGNQINSQLMSDEIHPNQLGHLEWAQLIIDNLGLSTWGSRVTEAGNAIVTKTGSTVKLPGVTVNEDEMVGSSGLNIDGSLLESVAKHYDGTTVDTITDNVADSSFTSAAQGNITVRFKLDTDADTSKDLVLAAFGDPTTGKQLTVSVFGTSVRLGRDFGSGYGYFTFFEGETANVKDGEFHTVSMNIADNQLSVFIDGKMVKNTTADGLNVAPNRYGINTVTVGGPVKAVNTISNGTATVDYVQAFGSYLTSEQLQQITYAPANQPSTSDDDASDSAALTALQGLYKNSEPTMWSFLGGATTQGTLNEVSAKSYVQAFEEVLRWEHDSSTTVARSKFVENAGLNGLTSAQLVDRYNTEVANQKPVALFINPDVLYKNELVETDVDAFKANITSIVTAAKAAGTQVVLVTPAQLGDQVTPYADALRAIAADQDTVLIDATAWVNEVNSINDPGVVAAEWYDNNGFMTAKGQLELAKYILTDINLLPANLGTSKIWALNYDGNGTKAAKQTPVYSPGKCAWIEVTPAAPTQDGSAINIPTSEGVEYLFGNQVVTGTLTNLTPGSTVTITARTIDGYLLAEGAVTSWDFVIPQSSENGDATSADGSGMNLPLTGADGMATIGGMIALLAAAGAIAIRKTKQRS